jgi:hypothetical protein
VVNDEVNYVKLLSDEYLGAGFKVRNFVYSFLIARMVKVIKKVGILKKKKKKKDSVRRPDRTGKKK